MGVIALGIGFGTPLAIAGVVLHVAGHALAKALGFYAAMPLLARPGAGRPPSPGSAARTATRRRDGRQPRRARRAPPSPLFVDELLILLGGFAAGRPGAAAAAAVAARARLPRPAHALIEARRPAKARRSRREAPPRLRAPRVARRRSRGRCSR